MYAVVSCQCKHEFQDKRYGNQNRLANLTQKAKATDRATVRCTVCGKEHDVAKTLVKK